MEFHLGSTWKEVRWNFMLVKDRKRSGGISCVFKMERGKVEFYVGSRWKEVRWNFMCIQDGKN